MTRISKGVLGVDIGGVIMSSASATHDTSFFGPNYLATPALDGAVASLRKLSDEGFQIWLVSKCGESVEKKTRHWLDHHDFYRQTGIDRNRVRFCRTRAGKAPICDEIGAAAFIDDRLEVLSHLVNVPRRILFRGDPREVARFKHDLRHVIQVWSWNEAVTCLLGEPARTG